MRKSIGIIAMISLCIGLSGCTNWDDPIDTSSDTGTTEFEQKAYKKLGQEYFEKERKAQLDSVYGKGNYKIAVLLVPSVDVSSSSKLRKYDYDEDIKESFEVYLAIKSDPDTFDKQIDAEKLLGVYNEFGMVGNYLGYSFKSLQVGYFSYLDDQVDEYLDNINHDDDTRFEDVFTDNIHAQVYLSSISDGYQFIDKEPIEIGITEPLRF